MCIVLSSWVRIRDFEQERSPETLLTVLGSSSRRAIACLGLGKQGFFTVLGESCSGETAAGVAEREEICEEGFGLVHFAKADKRIKPCCSGITIAIDVSLCHISLRR